MWVACGLVIGSRIWPRAKGPQVVLGPFNEWLALASVPYRTPAGRPLCGRRMYQRRQADSPSGRNHQDPVYERILVLLLLAVLTMLLVDFEVYRRHVLFIWAITSLLVSVGRIIHTQFQWSAQSKGIGAQRVLLVGSGQTAAIILQKVRSTPKLGFVVAGAIPSDNGTSRLVGVPVLGTVDEIPEVVAAHDIDEVIIGMPGRPRRRLSASLAMPERKGWVCVFPDLSRS